MNTHRACPTVAVVVFLTVLGSVIIMDSWLHTAASSPLMQPSPPARFFGTVTIDGTNVPTGTVLSASIDGTVYATTVITFAEGVSSYYIDVPGDDPGTSSTDGGRDGDKVVFKMPGYTAAQIGIWQADGIIELNLSMRPNPISEPLTIPEPVTIVLFGMGAAGLSAATALRKRGHR